MNVRNAIFGFQMKMCLAHAVIVLLVQVAKFTFAPRVVPRWLSNR